MTKVTGPVRPECHGHTTSAASKQLAWWHETPSIAESVTLLERELVSHPDEDIPTIYERLYVKHFGVQTNAARYKTSQGPFDHVKKTCEKYKIDPELYITAQMDSLSRWLSEPEQVARKIRFRPRMLGGEGAARRYNGYLITSYHRMRQVDSHSLDARSFEGKVYFAAYKDELDIVGDYVNDVYSGGIQTYEQTAKSEPRSLAWQALLSDVKGAKQQHVRMQIIGLRGLVYPKKLRMLVRLRVALAICERFRRGLSVRLGVRGDFSWSDFAGIVKRIVPCTKRESGDDLTGIGGMEWGLHG